jgi:hypothetical protein
MARSSERRGGGARWSNSCNPLMLSYRIVDSSCWRSLVWGARKEVKRLESETRKTKAIERRRSPSATERLISQHAGRQSTRERARKDNLISCFARTGSRLGRLCAGAIRLSYVEFAAVRSCRPPMRVDCRTVLQQSIARQSTGTTNETEEPESIGFEPSRRYWRRC